MNLPMLTRRNNVRVMVSLCLLATGSAFAAAPAGSSGSSGSSGGTCAAAWSASVVYTGGMTASENSTNYLAVILPV
jgi:chitinase